MGRKRQPVCARGHDIAEVGRYPGGACIACSKITAASYHRRTWVQSRLRHATWKRDNPGAVLSHHWKKVGVLNAEGTPFHSKDFYALFDAQNGACKICRTPAADLKKRLCVDHDHKTGFARGLLCESCNFALGKFRDNPTIVRAAASYLEAA